jgi:ribosomal protein L11 methyltransferase
VRELTLRVPAAALEDVLDAVLPALPGGAHVREEGNEAAVAILSTPGTPGPEELRGLAAPHLIELSEAEVSEDWRERRLARYEPLIVADRFLIRPGWAPPAADPNLSEIVLEQSTAFGTGVHPTTQACLALLTLVQETGSFADYGCGSGVLSIAAAKLGFSPVVAVDLDQASVEAAGRNAARNEAAVEARRVDVTAEPAPAADTVAANVPPQIQMGLAAALDRPPTQAIVSGFKPAEAESVASAWGAHGLTVEEQLQAQEWTALLLR